MSDENKYPDKYPHDNAWHISMGFDPIKLPQEFMSVYGDPIVESEVKTILLNKQRNKKSKKEDFTGERDPQPEEKIDTQIKITH